MYVRFEAMGTVEIHGVRRIEEDHLCWYVWYGKPSDGPAFLRPQIFRKDAGTLTVMEEELTMVDSIKYTDYDLLRRRVIANPTSIRNMTDLALWFELFGMDFWNGEYWDADGYSLKPIFEWDPVTDQQNTIGYEWRVI